MTENTHSLFFSVLNSRVRHRAVTHGGTFFSLNNYPCNTNDDDDDEPLGFSNE